MKYLGILIDSQLTFKHHIANVVKKVSRVTGLMYKIRNCVDNKTLEMIYYSLIYPNLLYAIPIWGNSDLTHIKPLLNLQKKAVRLILNKHRNVTSMFQLPSSTARIIFNDNQSILIDVGPMSLWYVDTFVKVPSDPIFKKLEILKVTDLFKLCTLKFVYDSLNKLNPLQFHTYYNYPLHNYNTEATRNLNLNLPTIRTSTYGLRSLKYTGCMLWNNLSLAEKNIKSKKVFSRILKKRITDAYDN